MLLEGASSLTPLTTIFQTLMTWVGQLLTTITTAGNEILLIPVGVFVVGAVIGLCSRLIGR